MFRVSDLGGSGPGGLSKWVNNRGNLQVVITPKISHILTQVNQFLTY